jgi:FHA domain-containing protein
MTPSYILITHPDGRQQAIPLRAGTLRIGSAPDNDLVLAGPGIAPWHATIHCDDEGDLLLTLGGREARNGAPALEIELPRAFATALLARMGGYALRYQPAARPSHQRSHADHWMRSYADAPADESALLSELLDQRIIWLDEAPERAGSHEAVTIEMQTLRGAALGE